MLALNDRLGELTERLRDESDRLQTIGGSFDGLTSDVADIEASVLTLSTDIDEAGALLDDYRTAAEDGEALVGEARLDLKQQITSARLVAVMIGLCIALAQAAPASTGWLLIKRKSVEASTAD